MGEGHYISKQCQDAYVKLLKLSERLKYVNLKDGKLTNIRDNSIIKDEHVSYEMHIFRGLAKAFVSSVPLQNRPHSCFQNLEEKEPIVLDSLTKVSDLLNVSAQQRKAVRLMICPQVTQYHIWRGALEEILKDLKGEIDSINIYSQKSELLLGKQIVSCCLQFFANMSTLCDADTTPSWMRLTSRKKPDLPSPKWGDVLEMTDDLLKCLKCEMMLRYHVLKLQSFREGLFQIKEVLADRDVSYREVRHQEYLLQKKLTQHLGHSSKCLFTLLLYYLFGNFRDIELDVCHVGGAEGNLSLCVGNFLTADDEKMVNSGVRHLDQALKLFKFIWETAKIKRPLELHGHLWCINGKERKISYRGNVFFVHGMEL